MQGLEKEVVEARTYLAVKNLKEDFNEFTNKYKKEPKNEKDDKEKSPSKKAKTKTKKTKPTKTARDKKIEEQQPWLTDEEFLSNIEINSRKKYKR